MIFARYLALKSFRKLIDELSDKGIVTKKRTITGKIVGGIPFTCGPLAYLLKNRTYLGETGHKERWYPGEHDAIIEPALFDAVQSCVKSNSITRRQQRSDNQSLLAGLLFDDRGNRMSSELFRPNAVCVTASTSAPPFSPAAAMKPGR